MTPYSLSRLASRPKGAEVRLPPIEERLGTVLAYRTALRAMLREIAAEVRRSVLPRLREDRGLTTDAAGADWFRNLRMVITQLVRRGLDQFDRLARAEADRHTDRFRDSVRKALGIDIAAVVRAEDLDEPLRAMNARNAGLITSLAEDVVKDVEQIVIRASLDGTPMAEVSRMLQERFAVRRSRADLIATDQIQKITADLNRIRHQQAGVTEYDWRTSQDERVRSRHAALNGKRYRYGEPTGAEEGLPPGQPIRCRCVALAVVKF